MSSSANAVLRYSIFNELSQRYQSFYIKKLLPFKGMITVPLQLKMARKSQCNNVGNIKITFFNINIIFRITVVLLA